MRYFILLVLSLMIFSGVCSADIIVIYEKNTGEIYTVSSKDDTVVPNGYEKKTIKGDLSDFTDDNPVNYKFKDNKFIKNIDKIDREARAKEEAENNIKVDEMIQSKIREQAISELKKEGKLDDKGKIVK
jgi:hypothetical protein